MIDKLQIAFFAAGFFLFSAAAVLFVASFNYYIENSRGMTRAISEGVNRGRTGGNLTKDIGQSIRRYREQSPIPRIYKRLCLATLTTFFGAVCCFVAAAIRSAWNNRRQEPGAI